MEFLVRDGVRKRPFDGVCLAESSSKGPGKPRWIDFALYKTDGGQYVVARIGDSIYYHDISCETVSRNNLSAVDGLELSGIYIPCEDCTPSRFAEDGVFPETPRYAAWVCPDAAAVVASLVRRDANKIEYLTNVARRLLSDAAEEDSDIAEAFSMDRIK